MNQNCYLPMLHVLSLILVRDLDKLCATRSRYRLMRNTGLTADGVYSIHTPYDHVITRLERSLNDCYDNIDRIQAQRPRFLCEV
jgi:hypothetical protein